MPAHAGRCGVGAGGRGRYRGALLGWPFDLLAAALMGFMILRMGAELAWGASWNSIDTGMKRRRQVGRSRNPLATPGVPGCMSCGPAHGASGAGGCPYAGRSRSAFPEGHRIAESARAQVLRQHPEVLDVLVHIDPEDDLRSGCARRWPAGRVIPSMAPLLAGLAAAGKDRSALSGQGGR